MAMEIDLNKDHMPLTQREYLENQYMASLSVVDFKL